MYIQPCTWLRQHHIPYWLTQTRDNKRDLYVKGGIFGERSLVECTISTCSLIRPLPLWQYALVKGLNAFKLRMYPEVFNKVISTCMVTLYIIMYNACNSKATWQIQPPYQILIPSRAVYGARKRIYQVHSQRKHALVLHVVACHGAMANTIVSVPIL